MVYYTPSCQKMQYKAECARLNLLCPERLCWILFDRIKHALDGSLLSSNWASLVFAYVLRILPAAEATTVLHCIALLQHVLWHEGLCAVHQSGQQVVSRKYMGYHVICAFLYGSSAVLSDMQL